MAGNRAGKKQVAKNIFNRDQNCNVIIAATMSAGKTSLINALLGNDLLFSANEAATQIFFIPPPKLSQFLEEINCLFGASR